MGDEKLICPMATPERFEAVLRNLEDLLREKLGHSLIVDSFTTSSLVPPGENYGSTILKVEAKVRHDEQSSEPEKLSLVAKMIPPTAFQRMIFDTSFTFGKEIFMFTDIVPAYKALELECGIPETEVFDPLPKFYGSRLTLKEGENEVDEDAVILMENLKPRSYYCENRRLGLDMPHAKLVVETVARFHANGIAVKLTKPDLFNEFKTHCRPVFTKIDELLIQFLMRSVKKIPVLLPHVSRIEENLNFHEDESYSFISPIKPWGTIIHMDLWVNNIMFRDDEIGNPRDVKLVDFQGYKYQNPLQDLVFFLFTSCNEEVRAARIEDLIDLYYNKFVSQLARLKCDVSLFSRDSFNQQFRDAAKIEFAHCLYMIWPILADSESQPTGDPKLMFDVEPSEEFRIRLAEISLRFMKENWI